jgi:hypothetical protein
VRKAQQPWFANHGQIFEDATALNRFTSDVIPVKKMGADNKTGKADQAPPAVFPTKSQAVEVGTGRVGTTAGPQSYLGFAQQVTVVTQPFPGQIRGSDS